MDTFANKPIYCNRNYFPTTNNGDIAKKCWKEKTSNFTIDPDKKTCGGNNTGKIKVMNVYQRSRTAPIHDGAKTCTQRADVVFVLDESDTVRQDNFYKMKIAVQDIVRDVKTNGGADVKMGFVKFSSGALVETDLTDDLD